MFRHIVLYRLRPELGAQGRARIGEMIGSLEKMIPSVVELQSGDNAAPDGFTKGYDWGFCMTFTDRAARDAYIVHHEHQRVAAQVEELIEDLVVLGLDG
jgi:hypothetical protein